MFCIHYGSFGSFARRPWKIRFRHIRLSRAPANEFRARRCKRIQMSVRQNGSKKEKKTGTEQYSRPAPGRFLPAKSLAKLLPSGGFMCARTRRWPRVVLNFRFITTPRRRPLPLPASTGMTLSASVPPHTRSA